MVATNPSSLNSEAINSELNDADAINLEITTFGTIAQPDVFAPSRAPTGLLRLQLPTDFPRTADVEYIAAVYTFTLPALATVHPEVKDGQAVWRSLLLSAFTILLHRYTQQAEIPLAVTLASGLPHREARLEVCANFCEDLKVSDLMAEIAAQLPAVNRDEDGHRDRPCDEGAADQAGLIPPTPLRHTDFASLPVAVTLIEEVVPTQAADEPLQTSQPILPAPMASAPMASAPTPIHQLTCEIHLRLRQQGLQCAATLSYNANLFEASTIERLARHFQVLLAGLLAGMGDSDGADCADSWCEAIAQLPLLTPTEIRQQLVEWQSHTVAYPDLPLHRYIETHAQQRPAAIAATFQTPTFQTQSFSYDSLNQRANQLAHALQERGVGAGRPVAVCVSPALDILVCLLGVLKAGGIYVPLDPTHPGERLAVMLDDTQPQILLTQSHLRSSLPATSTPILCLDQDWERIAAFPTANLNTAVSLSQTAAIIYTSGTTGKPKGVMLSQGNLMNYVLLARDRYGISPQDVMPAIARYTFSITFFELLLPLVAGGQVVILAREHILDFKRFVQTLEQLTVLHASPSLMRKLLGYMQDQNLDMNRFQGLRHVSVGGDLADVHLLARMQAMFKPAEIFVIYGCSEVSCMGCTYPVRRADGPPQSRVGKPFNNVSVRLYDAHQNLVPIGVTGEIYFGGAGVTLGYLNRPELTQTKFVEIDGQRFYRTGDMGRFDADGNLEILGRSDFQIKLRGIRIELGEIEAALRQAPGVRDGVVMARSLGDRAIAKTITTPPSAEEKSLVAYVVLDNAVLDSRGDAAIADLRQFLQTQLPDYMVPAAFVVLEALPVNLNQKVDRQALPLPTAENLAGLQTIVPARDAVEAQLVQIWEQVLGIQPLGIDNNFFELGGDSLQAVQILTQIEQQLGQTLAITAPLQAPTIATLANLIRNPETQMAEGDVVPLRLGGRKPPLFCLYGVLLYRELAEHLDADRPVYGVYLQAEVDLLKTGDLAQFQAMFSNIATIADRYLTAIRQVQPCGPYSLAGESFGGIIAYEIAQQLLAVGECVELVALLDTSAPNLHAQLSRIQRLKIHGQIILEKGPVHLLEKIRQKQQDTRQQVISRLYPLLEKFSRVASAVPLSVSTGLPPSISPTTNLLQTASILQTSETAQADIREIARDQAADAYIPPIYEGRTVLVRAMQQDRFEAGDRTLGWGSRVPNLQVIDVPGDHLSILKAPNVQSMAQQLLPYLDERGPN